ncbi:hypothetical protein QBC46DRAFT_253798 [Diplogelasinospora grovesii]|uniref:Cell wall proline rich protein n=1 Tax=Diplogelasinospora grovesii TaxID=303347 RepID=A0AAN6NDF7_9PEZI|nr:hypothetical protein QBC46DRAFT_253798 [Diplogelasinospora grovesii]
MAENSTTDGFAGVPSHHFAVSTAIDGSPNSSPRIHPPLPNPPFVFPARPSSSSAPSSFSRASGRRPRSEIQIREPAQGLGIEHQRRPSNSPALPAFSFNPGASLPPPPPGSAFLSPPQTPTAPASPRAIPARPTGPGHKRGGSEFVGGKIRDGEAITVMGTSPTKSESGMASPMLQPTKPAGRRGHAHRRSAAISSHDLSSIILPPQNQNLRGSSAPSSPAATQRTDKQEFPVPEVSPAQSEPNLSLSSGASEESGATATMTGVQLQQPPKPIARNRVGFSDTLEFIPRPLSLVSTDTSSTVTARPGHSVSGSISSVISATNVEREVHSPLEASTTSTSSDRRPSTAGAILERTQSSQEPEQPLPSPRRRGSIPFLGALPPPTPVSPATPSPTKSGKKWSFFGLDPFVAASPTKSRPVSASSSESQAKDAAPARSSLEQKPDTPVTEPRDDVADEKPVNRKRSKKQKKVKTWAGSILSRKSKARHGKQKRRTPTPPPPRETEAEEEEDSDEAVIDMTTEPESEMPALMVKKSRAAPVSDEDASYPMIDLDAALGPFNTPLPRNAEWEAAQRAGGLVKKQLHSAAGMSRFTGPGMHYHHRRAESAPALAPVDVGRFGFKSWNSSSTMADVFEEDEEEDDEDSTTKTTTGQSTPLAETPVSGKPESMAFAGSASGGDSIKTNDNKSVAADDYVDPSASVKHKGSDLSKDENLSGHKKVRSEHSAASLHDDVLEQFPQTQEMAEFPGDYSIAVGTCNSATPSPRHFTRAKDLAPVEVAPLNLPAPSLAPTSPYSMTQSSAFPSPRSPMSYDAHRISTAPSSITEDNFHSLLMGEPGPEVRISVDDIPSLTSSNSTMTRESIFAQNPQARHPPLADQPRPASFTSTAFGRRRSSLASLSRLISSSHGERSKLSMEVPMDSEPEEHKTKMSKAKRLSRMIKFWKPKDSKESKESAGV